MDNEKQAHDLAIAFLKSTFGVASGSEQDSAPTEQDFFEQYKKSYDCFLEMLMRGV